MPIVVHCQTNMIVVIPRADHSLICVKFGPSSVDAIRGGRSCIPPMCKGGEAIGMVWRTGAIVVIV